MKKSTACSALLFLSVTSSALAQENADSRTPASAVTGYSVSVPAPALPSMQMVTLEEESYVHPKTESSSPSGQNLYQQQVNSETTTVSKLPLHAIGKPVRVSLFKSRVNDEKQAPTKSFGSFLTRIVLPVAGVFCIGTLAPRL